MAKAIGSSVEMSEGFAILRALKAILQRCEAAEVRLAYPGEGGERPFRGWLVSDLLTAVLGWPSANVVVGERFDILLQDAEGFPVATIETKTPYHKATKKERRDFEERLSGYGTLRTAYFTNGTEWERLDIFSPTGMLEIRERFEFHLNAAGAEEAEAFFAPLAANRHFTLVPRSSRHAVKSENPHILEALAADLDSAITDIASFLESQFSGLREGRAGDPTRTIVVSLFDLWCEKSLIVSPRHAARRLADLFEHGEPEARDIRSWLVEMGFTGPEGDVVADALASLPAPRRRDAAALTDALRPAYASAVRKLAVQTAHVVVARTLLYRIGEDQGVFPRFLSGDEMERRLATVRPTVVDAPRAGTDLLERVRQSMHHIVPSVYELGEFDWWQVMSEKRPTLTATESAWLRGMDEQYERAAQRLLRMLNGYFFGHVDVDVWRNVYQHYLPADERQRLGGFYTPDELVNLVLDLAEFVPESEGLCQLSFVDPACGSGAFVTGALARLLKHLELDLPCHSDLRRRGIAHWKRAEAVLNIAARNLHAVDLHPFAAFLTTLNVLFLLMPLYVKAREKNPDYSLDLQVFSADSLEKQDKDLLTPDLFAKLNSRIQLTEESFRRYQEMLTVRFDRVFGNPPWGGVLKGRLAPIYETAKKQRFATEFPWGARGKYDVYGLFVERALQILKPGGRLGLLTQDTFVDKRWAAGLRELLAAGARLRFIVDLNPFGQLFFHAMNTPCITVADACQDRHAECIAVLSAPPRDFAGRTEEERRKLVVATIREAVKRVSRSHRSATVGFARAARIPLQRLRDSAKDRWNLAATEAIRVGKEGWITAADLFEASQGVTPGVHLELFLLSQDDASQLGLEEVLVYRAIKSKEVARWRATWSGRVLLYPYLVAGRQTVPAFTVHIDDIKDKQLANSVRGLALTDALDFAKQVDTREREIVQHRGVSQATVTELLKHRIALRLVSFPRAAEYLVRHYEELEGRVLEKKRFTDMRKRWYEYHRPRDPRLMFSRTRIVSPSLVKHVSFSLDTAGYLSDHACLFLQRTGRTERAYLDFDKRFARVLGRPTLPEDLLKYCLAFLNSEYAQERLVTGRRPTPKGYYPVTRAYLREIPIPLPRDKKTAVRVLDLVGTLTEAKGEKEIPRLEGELALVVRSLLKEPR